MIWKDRIKQYPHRYTLTNVSGSTYDFTEVTGEVIEAGTPVNAENMNKLLQRDGDDIKDTVTTFSEAGTRANIATGENTSTIFGKIKKWFTDLKPHAFNDLATALGAETDKAPTNKLLNDTAALKIDNTDISTTAPISSAAASNEKVYSEKLTYDEFAKKANRDNPTFTGTVTVPAPTNPTDAARLQDVTELAAVYDIVIKTQAEFEALIADSTWFGAKSVALVGQFTLSTANNGGVKRPANVTRIDGYNNAKITVTNFVFNSTTARGGLWDDENVNNPHCYINDLSVNCTGTGYACYGFNGDNNTYTNCTGTSCSSFSCHGFSGNNNTYSNCTGTGTSASNYGYGFSGNNNTYSNCTGSGIGGSNNGDGYGFSGNNNTYSNCTGTAASTATGNSYACGFSGINNTYSNCIGIGMGGNFHGYGFYGNNNRIISCTALAYISTNKTPNDTNCVPIHDPSTSTNLFMIIRDCKFPQIAKTGYQQGTIWCNIANNTTMVGSIKDNVYHSRFTVAPIKGANVVADNNCAVDITAI